MNNNDIITLVNNLIVSNNTKNYNYKIDDKFNQIQKLISLIQNEIIALKLNVNDTSKLDINNINNEIDNLKNLINNSNEISMIQNNDDIIEIKNNVEQLNNYINIELDRINDKIYTNNDVLEISKDINYIKSIIINDKKIQSIINSLLIKVERLEFVMIDTDFDENKTNFKLRQDEIINIRELLQNNENIYKLINDDIEYMKKTINDNINDNKKDIQINELTNNILNLQNDNIKFKQAIKMIFTKLNMK